MQEQVLTLKQAYLAMCEYLHKECELNNWKEVDIRGILAELELEGSWQSADPGATFQFEDAVKTVLGQRSRFDTKPLLS